MKTNTLLLTLLISIAVLVSCSKQDEDPIPSVPKIKAIYTFQNSRLLKRQSLEHDPLGRLIKITLNSGAYTTYTYTDSCIVKKDFDALSGLTGCDTLVLNPLGLAVTAGLGSKTFTYNENGYLTSEATRDQSLLISIKDGNAVSEIYQYPDNTVTIRMNWFMPNSVNTIGNENMGIFFLGKQDRQLIQSKNFVMGKTWTYQYEFDDRKRVCRCSRTDGTSEIYSTYAYYE